MQLISLDNLKTFKKKLDALFVKQEKKTGSDTELKVLSDNNLTDDLVAKINAAGAAADVTNEIATAKSEAIASAKSYTDTEAASAKTAAIKDAKSYTDGEITSAKSYADTEIGKAKTAAIDDAHSYADTAKEGAISTAKSYTDTGVAGAKSYADEQVSAAKSALEATINTKISTAYKVKGSIAFASLPTPAKAEEGNVYNVTDAFTTTANFIEGAGKKYPAGANVVCVEASSGTYKFDVLAGFIDSDSFVKNTDIVAVTEGEINALFTA